VIPPEPPLDAAEQELFRRGLQELNTGFYFECHETLEDLWTGVRGPARDFFQGLIQIAVGFYHLTRGNDEGAGRMLDRAVARLSKYPDHYGGVDLGGLRGEVETLRARIADGSVTHAEAADLPRCRPAPDATA
jgi:predicted metal-dependent hydrolase